MGEPTGSDDEVVSMDLDSDSPGSLNNESHAPEISRDQTAKPEMSNKKAKNETRVEPKTAQAEKTTRQESIPDSGRTLQDKPVYKDVSAVNHSRLNKIQPASNSKVESNENPTRFKGNVTDLNEARSDSSGGLPRYKETQPNIDKNAQKLVNRGSESGSQSKKSKDLTIQADKNANGIVGNIIQGENKGERFKHKESRLEPDDITSRSRAEKQDSVNTQNNNELTRSPSSPVFTQARNVQTPHPTVIQQTQNKQTSPPKHNQPSIVSYQQQKFKQSSAILHQHPPNIKQTTTASALQQSRHAPSPNNSMRQLSTTNQSNYRSSREFTQYSYHSYRSANIPHQNAQHLNNHHYTQPQLSMNGHLRFGLLSSQNVQRSSVNNPAPFRQQQMNYHQSNLYQNGQHTYRSNPQQNRQHVPPSQVSGRLSYSRSNMPSTRNHQSISPATSPHNNSSVMPQDQQTRSKAVEANKTNGDMITPDSEKSGSDNVNNPSVTPSLTENNLANVVESEVECVERMHVDNVFDAQKEPDMNSTDKQQNSPNQDKASELGECSSGNDDNENNNEDFNLTGQRENSETKEKVDKGKKVLVENEMDDTKSNKDAKKNATYSSDNAEIEPPQLDEETELLPDVLEKYRVFDEALCEFDEAAQKAYAAYQNLEKFLPSGTIIKIAPPSSLECNMIAKMMGITKKRGFPGSFTAYDAVFDEMNDNQNSSAEEGNYMSIRNKNRKFARNGSTGDDKQESSNDEVFEPYNGGDEDEDESMDDKPRVFETPISAKVHNTRSKRTRSNKKGELVTSSQIKFKITSASNESVETPSNVKKTIFENQMELMSKTRKKRVPKAKFIDPSKDFEWPLNAFGIFCSEYYGQLIKDDEQIMPVQFYKSAAERWTSITHEQKKAYEQKRIKLLARHAQTQFNVSGGTGIDA